MPFEAFSGRGWLFSFVFQKDKNTLNHRGPLSDSGVNCWRLARFFAFRCTPGAAYSIPAVATPRRETANCPGVAIEQCATVSLEVDAIKDWSCARPGLGRENFLVPLGRWKMRRASPIANPCAGRAPATASMRSTLTCFSVKQDASGSETWSIRKLPWVRRS
jgi:hypothetical protein